MKMLQLEKSLFVPLLLICCLVTVGASVAKAQGTPTSGAMLTIVGTVGTGGSAVAVNRTIYDSQIHTGTVQFITLGGGNCTAADQMYPTDAYVLQGGSWTGCDPGDAIETSQGTGTATVSGTGYSFAITTQYVINNEVTTYCTSAGVTPQICANPDSGFLTVTNNSPAAFSGTITLSGTALNPTEQDPSYCPPGGSVSDTLTTGLAVSAAATFALSSDSSNCGGFNAPQTQTLQAGHTTTFPIGNDDYQITPSNSNSGDMLTVLPIPVPAGPTANSKFPICSSCTAETLAFPTTPFSAPNYPGQTSIPYADLSAPHNPVSLEFQVTCAPQPGDCSSFLYTAQTDFTIDPNSLPQGIGGPEFLGQHDDTCPTTGFNINIFFSYSVPASDPPLKGTGAGNSCFVGTFDPNAAYVAAGQTVTQHTFVGFYPPVLDNHTNLVVDGAVVPLIWQTLDTTGKPVKNLTWCKNFSGTGCTAPWVFVGTNAISCSSGQLTGSTTAATGLGLLNFSLINGIYQFNLKTVRGSTGCFTPVLRFSSGLLSFSVANFKYL